MTNAPTTGEPRLLSRTQKFTYSLPSLAINLSGALFGSWLLFYYRPPADAGTGRVALVGASAWTVAMLLGRVVDALADPPIGYWSDRCGSRFGRRLPFVLFGTPLLAITFAALWFPPFAPGSLANDVYVVALMCLYWFAFTVVVAPYLSLLPEIAPGDHERVVVSSVMAGLMVIGMALGPALPDLLGDAVAGTEVFGLSIADPYQAAGLIGAAAILVMCLVPLLNIRERATAAEKSVPAGLYSGIKSAYGNPAFRTYVTLVAIIQMGLNLLAAVVPFLAKAVLERPASTAQRMLEVALPEFLRKPIVSEAPALPGLVSYGNGEAWVAILMAEVLVVAALVFPLVNLLHKRMSKKRMFLLAGTAFGLLLLATPLASFFPDPAVVALVIFFLMAFPVSAALVLPNAIFADVVDYDAARTGYRREGIFNGATALVTKAGIGVAQAMAVWFLLLGDSKKDPTGVHVCVMAAAALILLGTWFFRRHPIDK